MSAALDEMLTVVLVLKDRPEYTVRWLKYAELTGFPFKILIADGGKHEDIARLFAGGNQFERLNVEYVRYPPDATLHHFYAKITDALARVTTKYVMKASNDDFYSLEGVRRSVEFLEANPEYSGARGRILDFALSPRGIPVSEQFVFGKIERWHEFREGERSNDSVGALERVASQCKYYITCWHDVHRTLQQARTQNALLECDPVDARIADHIPDFLTIASGPVHRGEYAYMFRQTNPRVSEGKKLIDQFSTQAEWVASPWWKTDTENLYRVVGEEIAARDKVSPDSAKVAFAREYVGVYLADLLERDLETGLPLSRRLKLAVRRIVDPFPLIKPVGRLIALAMAGVRISRATKALRALGWEQDAAPIVRFLDGRAA